MTHQYQLRQLVLQRVAPLMVGACLVVAGFLLEGVFVLVVLHRDEVRDLIDVHVRRLSRPEQGG